MPSIKTKIKSVLKKLGYDVEARRRFRIEFFDQKHLLPEPKIIFDVGAHRGETVARYRQIYKDVKIYSFEPFEGAFEELMNRNREDRKFIPLKMALSDKKGETDFFVNDESATNSLFPPVDISLRADHDNDKYYVGTRKISVQTDTIDSFCKNNSIDYVDILKMDIQGGELKALEGARKMLDSAKFGLIYLEVEFVRLYEGQPLFHNICEYLNGFGYQLYKIYYLASAKNGQLIAADTLFVAPNFIFK